MHNQESAPPRLVKAIEQLRLHDHPCLIYESDRERLAVVIPFIRLGLERGERCLYLATETDVESILTELDAGGIGIADALARGMLLMPDMRSVCHRDEPFDPDLVLDFLNQAIKAAKTAGFTTLRLIGEMTWILESTDGTERLIEYEARLNDFLRIHDLPSLCLIDRSRFPPEVLLDIIRTHPKVIFGNVISTNYSYLPPDEFFRPDRADFEMEHLLQGMRTNEELITALRDRNALLNAAVENSTDAIYVKDLQGRYLMINPAGAAFIGRTVAEVLGRDDAELFSADSAETICAVDHQALTCGSPLTIEETVTAAGVSRTYLATKGAYCDAEGKVVGVFGIARDITERKRAEEELKLKSFTIDNLAEEILWTTAAGRIWNVNDVACKRLGYSRKELLSLSIANIDPLYRNEAWQPHWQELKRSGSLHFESLHKCKDGTTYPVEVIANYLNHNGFEYNCAIVRDITERKNMGIALKDSEERFRTLCDSAPIGIFRSDSEGNNIYCNPRWEEITGVSAPEGRGKGWFKAIHPDDRAELRKVWLEAMTRGHIFSHEHRQLTPQGKALWVRALANPIKSEDGRILGHVGTLEDITELRQARQDLMRSQKLESLGLLAGGIAHDFNNILTVILGNVSLARILLHEPEKLLQRLIEAEKATARAKDLTQQLLTFARGGEPVKKIIKIDSLLPEAAGFAIHGSAVRCEFTLADDLWPLEADEGQLSQVIHNLVINAAQAMPEGGIITIGAENIRSQRGKRFVRFSVADTGTGIPEAHLSKIFDPYFTTKQQGSGLGLATSYSIIKKHGGKIRVTSTLGKGSTFHVSLPASEHALVTRPVSRTDVSHGSGSVLVMDDEEVVRDITRALLEQLGYTVECVKDGSEVIDLYRKRKAAGTPFAVVIMDLTVPGGMGGKEAITLLRETDPNVKAVVSSGYSTDPVMANYREYGFSAVLSKPFRLQEMSKVLQELLPP